MIRDNKENIIKEIMNLRTMLGMLETKENSDQLQEVCVQLNKIQDMVFII